MLAKVPHWPWALSGHVRVGWSSRIRVTTCSPQNADRFIAVRPSWSLMHENPAYCALPRVHVGIPLAIHLRACEREFALHRGTHVELGIGRVCQRLRALCR